MGNIVKVDISEESFNKLNSIYIEAENFIKNFKREDYIEKVVVSTWWRLSSKEVSKFNRKKLKSVLPSYVKCVSYDFDDRLSVWVELTKQGEAIGNIIQLYLAGDEIYLDNYHATVFNDVL